MRNNNIILKLLGIATIIFGIYSALTSPTSVALFAGCMIMAAGFRLLIVPNMLFGLLEVGSLYVCWKFIFIPYWLNNDIFYQEIEVVENMLELPAHTLSIGVVVLLLVLMIAVSIRLKRF